MRTVCVVSGSRADYGLLYWLMKDIQASPDFRLRLAVTGMHLAPEFGRTVEVIRADGFEIAEEVESLLASDTGAGVAKSVGLGVLGFAEAYARMRPDLVLVLGDRFEIFAAAQAALFCGLPIAHIGGGDVTEGAFDEALRHGISKMAQLHFVTNEDARRRLMRLGEPPERIFDVGSPGLDHLHRAPPMSREALEQSLGFRLRARNFLVTFHPVTLDPMPGTEQLAQLLAALADFGEDTGLIFTYPNADTEGRRLMAQVAAFAAGRENARAFASLGQARYLAAVRHADAVIGNSSSGLYEAPSLATPTVNIGKRQLGRLRAESVFDCAAEAGAIRAAIARALAFGKRAVTNPYQRGDCARLILEALRRHDDFSGLRLKRFHDGEAPC